MRYISQDTLKQIARADRQDAIDRSQLDTCNKVGNIARANRVIRNRERDEKTLQMNAYVLYKSRINERAELQRAEYKAYRLAKKQGLI